MIQSREIYPAHFQARTRLSIIHRYRQDQGWVISKGRGKLTIQIPITSKAKGPTIKVCRCSSLCMVSHLDRRTGSSKLATEERRPKDSSLHNRAIRLSNSAVCRSMDMIRTGHHRRGQGIEVRHRRRRTEDSTMEEGIDKIP